MKRGVRIVLYVVFAIVILYFGAQWFLEGKIKNLVEKKISEMTQGTVKAEVGSVSLRLIGRALWLKDIKISSDTTLMHKAGLPVKVADGYLRRIGVSGIHFKKKDSVIHLRAKKFELDISRFSAALLEQKRDTLQNHRSVPELKLQIQTVNIRLDSIHCWSLQGKEEGDYRLNDFDGKIRDLKVNKLSQNTGLPFSCEDIQLSLSSFQYRFAENSQLLEIDSLRFQGEEGRFAVGAFRLIPCYSMFEFAQKAPGHTDWTRVEAFHLQGKGLAFQKLLTEKFIGIDSVSLRKASISSFKNRKIEQKPKIKKLFYESVQEFPLPLAVHRIMLNDIGVEYFELAKNGLSPGKITFNGLQGEFSGLTNQVVPGHTAFTLKVRGKLMDQGQIEAVFRLPVDSIHPVFEIDGRMGPLKLTALNPMIEPLAKIKIVSGNMEEMTFGIRGNSQKARVDMTFLYERLRIRIMKEKDGKLETRSFLTTLANGLIAKENNPDHRGVRKAEGWAERDPYRSQFNYLWKTLMEGLKESIGL